MFEIIRYNNKEVVEKYFDQIDIVNSSWVIPNLKTKNDLQKRLLESKNFFLNSTVIRIRDLWTHIFNVEENDYKIISNETYLILVKNILEKYKQQIQIEVVDYEKKCKDLNYFVSLILDDSFDLSSERFTEWLELIDRRKFQLKSELLVNKLIAQILINQKTIPFEWVTTLLQNKSLELDYINQKKIYFDLGSEISQKEAELIYQISKFKDVVVFESNYALDERYKYLLKPYEYLNAQCAKEHKSLETVNLKPAEINLRQFSNSVAECRDVVGQVKEWLELGILPEQIQILAPQIEMYWSQLEPLFKLEKISVQKNQVFKILSLPQVQRLISKVKFIQSQATSYDLEKLLFLNNSDSSFNYQSIRNLFSSPFLNFSDLLAKMQEIMPELVAKEFPESIQEVNLLQEMSREQFLAKFSFMFESELTREQFDFLIPELLKGTSEGLLLPLNDWFEWLKLSLVRLEMKIETNSEGIKVDSLMSSQSFNVDYVYVFGADDSYFSQRHDYEIEPDDILSLANDLGYHLDHPDYNFRSYELETVKEKTKKELILSYAKNSIAGEITNPCFMWQKLAFENKILEKHADLHKTTEWDKLLTINPEVFFKSLNKDYDYRNYEKDEDLDKYEALATPNQFNLSPSSVKNYSECSFKFFMERELRLNESDIEEIDISNKEKGLWFHKIFQKILDDEQTFIKFWLENESDEQRSSLLRERFENDLPNTVSKEFWQKVSNRYLSSVAKFIEHELVLRKEFPQLKTVFCEAKWSVYFDLAQQKWSKEKPDKGFLLKGTIDRVLLNQNTNKAWVVDYKLGASQAVTHNNWLKDNHWQLLFYSLAVENGWLDDFKYDVELAQFWVINKWDLKKGFALDVNNSWLLTSKKNFIAAEEKKDLFLQFEKNIFETLNEITTRKYIPKPKDEKTCKRCDWSLLCRAPHLN